MKKKVLYIFSKEENALCSAGNERVPQPFPRQKHQHGLRALLPRQGRHAGRLYRQGKEGVGGGHQDAFC